MDHNAVITYLKFWASKVIDIQFGDSRPWAFCHNIDELREEMINLPAGRFTMVLDDQHTGMIGGGSGNYQDVPRYTAMFVRKVEINDWMDEERAYAEAKAIALKLLAYIRHDNEEENNTIARHLVTDSGRYRRVGPQLDNLHGCALTLDFRYNINDVVVYNEDDYLD